MTPADPSPYRSPTPEQIDREEMSALRHLASELHAALRLSEEENLLLKGTKGKINPMRPVARLVALWLVC